MLFSAGLHNMAATGVTTPRPSRSPALALKLQLCGAVKDRLRARYSTESSQLKGHQQDWNQISGGRNERSAGDLPDPIFKAGPIQKPRGSRRGRCQIDSDAVPFSGSCAELTMNVTVFFSLASF